MGNCTLYDTFVHFGMYSQQTELTFQDAVKEIFAKSQAELHLNSQSVPRSKPSPSL
jgi:hypothetical protein